MLKLKPHLSNQKGKSTMSFLTLWFRDLFRPKITSVHVILYDKKQEKDISQYPDQYLTSLTKAIDGLWTVEKNSPFWFETEVYERRKCFQRPRTEMVVTCYSHDITANGFKKPFPIPIRYRKKLFDKMHPLTPEPVGVKSWPPLEVKFVLPHD